jgi:hypothetical protein
MFPSLASKLLGLPERTPKADATNNAITAATAVMVPPKTQRWRRLARRGHLGPARRSQDANRSFR